MTFGAVARIAGGLVLAGFAMACGPGHAADGHDQQCKYTLSPRPVGPDSAPPAAAPPFVAARSTVVVHAELPLAMIQKNLEAKVPRRVADVKDQDIGVAGRLEYTADRGAMAVSVQGDALAVDTPVIVHARACAKGSCYAGCDPEAHVTAKVPLRLGADYKFRAPAVNISITKGCTISALGGFARIDVTPMLESRLSQEKPRLEAQIRDQLPDLHPEAERIWNDLEKPRTLPLGSCIVLMPEGISQGVPGGTADAARLSFGLLAHPELRVRCGDASTMPHPIPLPPLHDDNALTHDGDIHLSVILPPEAPASSFEGAQDVIDLGAGHGHLAHATGTIGSTAPGLAIDLSGESCGQIGLRALGATWSDDGRALRLAKTAFFAGDSDRVTAAGLDPNAFLKSIETVAIPVPISTSDLKTTIPTLAAAESDPRVDVSVVITDAKPGAAGFRGAGELVGVVDLKGSATLRAK